MIEWYGHEYQLLQDMLNRMVELYSRRMVEVHINTAATCVVIFRGEQCYMCCVQDDFDIKLQVAFVLPFTRLYHHQVCVCMFFAPFSTFTAPWRMQQVWRTYQSWVCWSG